MDESLFDVGHKECDNKADGRQWWSSRLYKASGRRRLIPRVLADRKEAGKGKGKGRRGRWTLVRVLGCGDGHKHVPTFTITTAYIMFCIKYQQVHKTICNIMYEMFNMI